MNKPNCFSYSKCNCCTKTGECTYYQQNKNQLNPFKSVFESQISNPAKDLFN